VAQVQSVTDSTTLQLNRGWYNIPAANTFVSGSVLQKLSSNVELVQHTVTSSAVNGVQTITRGEFNTTALTAAGVGSPFVRMTGMFYGGSNTVPTVTVNVTARKTARTSSNIASAFTTSITGRKTTRYSSSLASAFLSKCLNNNTS
jgi:hypothetical protein